MKIKKGIILAGGTGSRLGPLSRVTNKHLLGVALAPMIYYPLSQLLHNGIKDICIVSGLFHLGNVIELLGSGNRFNCSFTYKVQDGPGGIAEALALCENFAGDEAVAVLLGDNIFAEPLNFEIPENYNAVFFLKSVLDPNRFGVAEVDHLKKLIDIEEKPNNPKSNLAVTGAYLYDKGIWPILKTISRSVRGTTKGELEISEANKVLIKTGNIYTIELNSWWSDAGTQESYLKANKEVLDNLHCDISDILGKMINS